MIEIVGEPVANPATGTVDFQLLRLNSHTTQPELDRTNLIALQATLKGDAIDQDEKNAVITSPYVAVYDNILAAEDVRIADKETLFEGGNAAHYATTFDACTKEEPRYETPYDQVFDLKNWLQLVSIMKMYLLVMMNSRLKPINCHTDLL